MMAFDVRIHRLDTDDFININVDGETTMDELTVLVTDQCNISPVARTLFAFKKVKYGLLMPGTICIIISDVVSYRMMVTRACQFMYLL